VAYLGAVVASGPAPQGVPLVPLAVGAGELEARPSTPSFGSVLDWYRYATHVADPWLLPEHVAADERLRYRLTEDREDSVRALAAEQGRPRFTWFLDKAGEVARPEDFREIGDGAPFMWRPQGPEGYPVIVLKVDPGSLRADAAIRTVLREEFLVATPDGAALIGFSAVCKHFGCAPGWNDSRQATQHDALDKLYCSCHHSVYDPFRIRADFFLLREAPQAKAG
jgi:nitrite reductase/ring-hydroxylating ferredoxin subunit